MAADTIAYPTLKTMPSSSHYTHLPLLLALSLALLAANAHPCNPDFAAEIQERFNFTSIQSCTKKALKTEFAWNFHKPTRQLDIAFGAKLRREAGWLAWGLNPYGPHMVGTRALIGIKHQDGLFEHHIYNLTRATKTRRCPLTPSDLGLHVTRFKFEYMEASQYYVIVATILLPEEFNSSRTNVVWQMGEAVAGDEPLMHPKSLNNFDSTAVLDLERVEVISHAHERRNLRTVHGVMNMVGWGTLLPSGVIVARYTRMFPKPCKCWYDVHVSLQTAGYVIGSGGWGLGMWLGKTSRYYSFNIHRTLGLLIFIFTTIQMMAWRLRPAPRDEYRSYWNMYHHFLGYAILSLIWVNIFVGIKIVEPRHVWKWAYIGVVGGLGMVGLAFEIWGWISFLVYKTSSRPKEPTN